MVLTAEIESVRDYGSHMHIVWLSQFHLQWSLEYEKTIRKMGSAFTYNQPWTQQCDNFEEVFGVLQPQSRWAFASFHTREQNMDSPQQTWDPSVSPSVWIGAQDSPVGSVSQQSHNHNFWDACGIAHIDNFQQEKTNQWRI